eukprot:GHVU01119725.1.p1 GENE.GHVU01119725.1~~GHVU01119725.1.p1  ORF type:complete len:270 (-),score=25.14 GHVU01119725.1:2775-3584(-)
MLHLPRSVHQTLDVIDGKQARRTNSSSPLGQLFDHGCDILGSTLFVWVALSVTAVGIGNLQWNFIAVSVHFHQFMYMWGELHSHVFHSCTGEIGVTEAQMTGIVSCALAGLFGIQIFAVEMRRLAPLPWLQDLIPRGFQVRDAILWLIIVINVLVAIRFIARHVKVMRNRERSFAALQLLFFTGFLVAESAFYNATLIDLEMSPLLIICTLTTAYAIIATRLLLSATCRVNEEPLRSPAGASTYSCGAGGVVALPLPVGAATAAMLPQH